MVSKQVSTAMLTALCGYFKTQLVLWANQPLHNDNALFALNTSIAEGDKNVISFAGIEQEIISHDYSAGKNVMWSQQSVGFILWVQWMSVTKFMSIHPIVVKIFQSWWTNWQTSQAARAIPLCAEENAQLFVAF